MNNMSNENSNDYNKKNYETITVAMYDPNHTNGQQQNSSSNQQISPRTIQTTLNNLHISSSNNQQIIRPSYYIEPEIVKIGGSQ
jgi:hypothetical protein